MNISRLFLPYNLYISDFPNPQVVSKLFFHQVPFLIPKRPNKSEQESYK